MSSQVDHTQSKEHPEESQNDIGIKGIVNAFREAWAKRNSQESRAKGTLDFLPAALEILEKPPSPAGRLLGWSLVALFSVFVGWGLIGKVDIVASAEGRIIPSGRVKVIQPMQMGVINSIFVREGQMVQKGEPLIELDQTLTQADRNRLRQELQYLRQSYIRELLFEAVLDAEQKDGPITAQTAQSIITDEFSHYQEKYPNFDNQRVYKGAVQKWQQYQTESDVIESQIRSRQSELQTVKETITGYQQSLPLIGKRVAVHQELFSRGITAEVKMLELKEQWISQQQGLKSEEARVKQIQAAIDEVKQNLKANSNTARKANLEAIEDLQQKVQSLQQDLNKANDLNTKQILYAPVTGRIQQLAVHTIGGVVEAAQPLMQLVPEQDFLEVEATLENKDIGYISIGQTAEIKIHTFPFTKYGVIDAEVIGITADAIESEQQGLIYKMRLKMQDTKIRVNHRWVDLLPGMEVTAEIKTGKRRLIEFFLSPLLRYKDESVRER